MPARRLTPVSRSHAAVTTAARTGSPGGRWVLPVRSGGGAAAGIGGRGMPALLDRIGGRARRRGQSTEPAGSSGGGGAARLFTSAATREPVLDPEVSGGGGRTVRGRGVGTGEGEQYRPPCVGC